LLHHNRRDKKNKNSGVKTQTPAKGHCGVIVRGIRKVGKPGLKGGKKSGKGNGSKYPWS